MGNSHDKISNLLAELRKANPIIENIFLNGSCCNLYFILKSVFPTARAYFNIDHVITRIGNRYYDITGEIPAEEVYSLKYIPIEDMYYQKYKDDTSIRLGEMYDPQRKTLYRRV